MNIARNASMYFPRSYYVRADIMALHVPQSSSVYLFCFAFYPVPSTFYVQEPKAALMRFPNHRSALSSDIIGWICFPCPSSRTISTTYYPATLCLPRNIFISALSVSLQYCWFYKKAETTGSISKGIHENERSAAGIGAYEYYAVPHDASYGCSLVLHDDVLSIYV